MSGVGAPEPRDPGLPTGPRGPQDPGLPGDVEARLAAVLRTGLQGRAGGPVDVDQLLAGAAAGARRIRRRRRTAVGLAAAVVLIGLPAAVGIGWLGAGSSSVTSQGSGAASSPHGPAAASSGTQVSGTVLTRDAAGHAVPGEWAMLQAADLGVDGSSRTQDEVVAAGAGPTAVVLCAQLPAASARAAGGRSVRYVSAGADGSGKSGLGLGWEVGSVVRVLPGTAAADEMAWLRRSVGACAGSLHLSRAAVAGIPGDGVVLGYQVGDPSEAGASSVFVVGVVQRGRTTASIELTVPAGAAADRGVRIRLGLDEARQLLASADRRLVVSGLVAAAEADPLLAR
jgi:hypothetical protein